MIHLQGDAIAMPSPPLEKTQQHLRKVIHRQPVLQATLKPMALHHLAIHGDGVIQGITHQQPEVRTVKVQNGEQLIQLREAIRKAPGPGFTAEQHSMEVACTGT